MHRHFSIWVWVVGSLVAAAILTTVREEQIDARVYRVAAERFARGEQIYRPSDSAAFTYPPFFVFAYVPFTAFPRPYDRVLWSFANLLLLGYILRTLHGLAASQLDTGAARSHRPVLVGQILIGVFAARFLISPIEYQGHDLIVFALLISGLAALARERSGVSGMWSGLAAACKATPLLMLVPYFWQRRWTAMAATLLVLAAASLLPDAAVRNPDGGPWLKAWYDNFLSHVEVAAAPEADGAWNQWNMLNQSLCGTFYRLFTPVTESTEKCWNVCLLALSPSTLNAVSAAVKLLVLALVSYAVLRSQQGRGSTSDRSYVVLLQGASVVCGMLLLSPMSSKQHFCVLVLPITVMVIEWVYYQRGWLLTTLMAITFVLGPLAGKDVIGSAAHRQFGAYGSLTWCTLCYLLACCLIAGRLRVRSAIMIGDAPSIAGTLRKAA